MYTHMHLLYTLYTHIYGAGPTPPPPPGHYSPGLAYENRRKIEPKRNPLLFDSLPTCCIYPVT